MNFVEANEVVARILLEECKQDVKLALEVRDRHKKSKKVVKIRREVLLRLRSEVWEQGNSLKLRRTVQSQNRPGKGWRPISFPQISRNLGGNHSAWVKMNNELKKEAAK